MQRLEEDAYFRAEIRRCAYEIEINGHKYKVYAKGPTKNSISWNTKKETSWNDADNLVTMYITKNEETEAFLHRFTKIKLNGKPWEVQTVDTLSTSGIIDVYLKEWYQNTIQDEIEKENSEKDTEDIDKTLPHIEGDAVVYPFDEKEYQIINAEGGEWIVSNKKKAIITSQTSQNVKLQIITGKTGEVNLIYKRKNEEDITLKIVIKSL